MALNDKRTWTEPSLLDKLLGRAYAAEMLGQGAIEKVKKDFGAALAEHRELRAAAHERLQQLRALEGGMLTEDQLGNRCRISKVHIDFLRSVL